MIVGQDLEVPPDGFVRHIELTCKVDSPGGAPLFQEGEDLLVAFRCEHGGIIWNNVGIWQDFVDIMPRIVGFS